VHTGLKIQSLHLVILIAVCSSRHMQIGILIPPCKLIGKIISLVYARWRIKMFHILALWQVSVIITSAQYDAVFLPSREIFLRHKISCPCANDTQKRSA
jgi:hypothetical protein